MYGYSRLRLRIVVETAPKGILIKKAVLVTRSYAEKMQMYRLRLAFLADLMNNIRIGTHIPPRPHKRRISRRSSHAILREIR